MAKTDEEIEKIALEIYEGEACRQAFAEAWEMYPAYNEGGDDTDEAQEHIRDRLVIDGNEQEKRGLDDEDLERVLEELSEMIYAGLT